MQVRRITKYIIVHCSYTPVTMDIGAKEIRQWHVKDNGWSDIGYQYVIRRDGSVETGRKENLVGSHCKGRNSDSIGICLVGGKNNNTHMFNFTDQQMQALRGLIDTLQEKYDNRLVVAGHNQFSPKACPTFRADKWYEDNVIEYV